MAGPVQAGQTVAVVVPGFARAAVNSRMAAVPQPANSPQTRPVPGAAVLSALGGGRFRAVRPSRATVITFRACPGVPGALQPSPGTCGLSALP
jgi:hypothetical protein